MDALPLQAQAQQIAQLGQHLVGGVDVAVHEGGDGMQRVEEEVGLQLVAQDLQSRPGQVILQLRGAQLTLAHGPLVLDRVHHSDHQRQHQAFVEEALDQVRLDLRERRREPPQPDGEIDGVLEHHQHRDGAEVEGHISPAPGAERPAPDGPDEGESGRDTELEGEQVEREQARPLGRLVRVDPVEGSEARRKKRDHRPDGDDHRRVAQAASRRRRQRTGRRRLGRHICGEDGAVHRKCLSLSANAAGEQSRGTTRPSRGTSRPGHAPRRSRLRLSQGARAETGFVVLVEERSGLAFRRGRSGQGRFQVGHQRVRRYA